MDFLLEKGFRLGVAVDSLLLTEVNAMSQQQLPFLSRCQALLLRDGGRSS